MTTTLKDLKNLVDRLNGLTENPKETWTSVSELGFFKCVANIGNYYLYQAYGKVGLHQITNEGGGIREIFSLTTKPDLDKLLRAFLKGFEASTVASIPRDAN